MKTFTAVTYNVLAQSYVHADRYPMSPREALEPAGRHVRLLDRIVDLEADLLCLQELEPALHDDLRSRLDATHHSAYARRRGRPDGAGLYARRPLFQWHGHDVLHFQAQRPGDDNLALIVQLTLDGQTVHVACTHLAWQPNRTPETAHVGYRQMLELLDYRDTSAQQATWVFAGDFNATAQSTVVMAALQRGMDESCRSQRPWDTTTINGRPRKIDYLLHTAGRLTPHARALPTLSSDTALPSLAEPSDHLPLQVDFAYTP